MVANKKSAKRRKPLVVTLTIIGSVIFLGFGIFFSVKAYDHYETYRDRPLAEGYEYVGRDYRDSCIIRFIRIDYLCHVMEVEEYYFATDNPPEELAVKIPGWSVGERSTNQVYLWDNSLSPTEVFNIYGTTNGAPHASYVSYLDHEAVIRASNLKNTEKKYIISISKDAYEKLVDTQN